MRNVSQSLVLKEVQTARDILTKWVAALADGVPGEDYQVDGSTGLDNPEAPRNPAEFYEKLSGELLLVSGKCETLTTILNADLG
jgi:hypothetical protein